MLWFTSDLHLGHENIIRFTGRPWATAAEMNEALIDNINACVKPGDTLYILGDVSFRAGFKNVAETVGRIACRHVRLIRGNHDGDVPEEGFFEAVRDYEEVKYHGRKLCLMHYPLLTWNGIYYGSIHLHGHIHSQGDEYNRRNLAQGYLRYDVGVDANGYRPVSFTEIEKFFKDAQIVTPRRDNENAGVKRQNGKAAVPGVDMAPDDGPAPDDEPAPCEDMTPDGGTGPLGGATPGDGGTDE